MDIKKLEQFESQWFSDFRAFPFEDVDLTITNANDEIVGVDIDLLESELNFLRDYVEEQKQENIGDLEAEEFYNSWLSKIDNMIECI